MRKGLPFSGSIYVSRFCCYLRKAKKCKDLATPNSSTTTRWNNIWLDLKEGKKCVEHISQHILFLYVAVFLVPHFFRFHCLLSCKDTWRVHRGMWCEKMSNRFNQKELHNKSECDNDPSFHITAQAALKPQQDWRNVRKPGHDITIKQTKYK